MQAKDILDIIALACALAVAVTVGKTNIKKQTIVDLTAANVALKERVDLLTQEKGEMAQEILHLRETVDGFTELVRTGYLAGGNRQGSGNRPASTQNTKNRSS